MRRLLVWTLAAGLLLSSGAALAQQNTGLEIIPFGGYRWGGGMSSIPGLSKFDTKDNWSYGIALDKFVGYNSAVELYWGEFRSDINANLLSPTGVKLSHDFGRDDFMLNGVWYAVRDPGAPAIPYFTAGLGASVFSATGANTVTRFAWNIGAGVRKQVNEKLALRVDGRWMPTWVTTGSSMWCDYYYGCYTVGTGEFYDQFELSLGLAFKAGK